MDEGQLRTFASQLSIRLGQYKSSQGWIVAPCPLAPYRHEKKIDRTPSFAIHVNNSGVSAYKCFTCKSHGSLNKLAYELAAVRKDDKLKEVANAIQMAELYGFKPTPWNVATSPVSAKAAATHRDIYPSFVEDRYSVAYLRQRGISISTALALGLRCDPERGRVLFPIYDIRRRFRGYSGRAIELPNIPDSVKVRWLVREVGNRVKIRDYLGLPKREILLGEHLIDPRIRRIILVEGLFAYARLRQLGFKNVVALLGSIITEEKAQLLLNWKLPLICLTDNDQAGREAIYGTRKEDGSTDVPGVIDLLYAKIPILIPAWPNGKNDPDELDKEEATKMFDEAELFTYA